MTAYRILGISSDIAAQQAQVPVTPSPVHPPHPPPLHIPTLPMVSRNTGQWFIANSLKNCLCGLFTDIRIQDDPIQDNDDPDDDEDMSAIDQVQDLVDHNGESTWPLPNTGFQGGEDFLLYSDDETDIEDKEDNHEDEEEQEEDEDQSLHHGYELEHGTLLLDSWTFGR
ncbi:hypothetical protein EMPS_04326 [Entomortierella parvispora]|uniref:Uncharacterized protein n=1 Tax=Entomortierella parvispora TaxID=205924 RepID=A0A9P3H8B4_9FUNG|nr:hypothetical protein EMPS_04326 [Entomortierella parvispora]